MADIEIFYFDVAHATEVHKWIIENSGGIAGVRNVEQLESVLTHIQNDLYYPNFDSKLCHLVFGVNKFHAFNDGNKRASIVLAAYFLELNGYSYCIENFLVQMEEIVVWLAMGKISKDLLQQIVTSLIEDDEFSESLKLALVEAVTDDDI